MNRIARALPLLLALAVAFPADAIEFSARYGRGGVYRYQDSTTNEFLGMDRDYAWLHAVHLSFALEARGPVVPWFGLSVRTFGGRLPLTPDHLPADLETQATSLKGGVRWAPETLRVGRVWVFTEAAAGLVWTRDVARTLSVSNSPETQNGWSPGLELAGGIAMQWRPGLHVDVGVGWFRTGRQTSELLYLGDRAGPSEYELFIGMTFRPPA